MIGQSLRLAGYRVRTTSVRRWTGYLGVVLLIGLIGGVAMASLAAGRRAQFSYPTVLVGTNPSDLTFLRMPNPALQLDRGI